MKFMRRALPFIAGILLLASPAYAAWPSVSARTKTWGAEVLTPSDLHGQFDLIHTYINAMMNGTTGHGHTGSTNDGPKLSIASALTIASQAAGDLIYASSSTVWARLAKGTDGQFLGLSSGVPTWITANTPLNYRSEMFCAQASTVTITVSPGTVEVNGALVTKTANTTLTLTTAGNWAGGVSQQATSTTGFIIIDASGNVKLTTTAPAFGDYAVSVSAANITKRYATVSGTVYRYIGWFRMNATGSGELDVYGVSNLLDVGVRNVVKLKTGSSAHGTTNFPIDNTLPQTTEGTLGLTLGIRPTNVNSQIKCTVVGVFGAPVGNGTGAAMAVFNADISATNALDVSEAHDGNDTSVIEMFNLKIQNEYKATVINYSVYTMRFGFNTADIYMNADGDGTAVFNGGFNSYIELEELPSQVTA